MRLGCALCLLVPQASQGTRCKVQGYGVRGVQAHGWLPAAYGRRSAVQLQGEGRRNEGPAGRGALSDSSPLRQSDLLAVPADNNDWQSSSSFPHFVRSRPRRSFLVNLVHSLLAGPLGPGCALASAFCCFTAEAQTRHANFANPPPLNVLPGFGCFHILPAPRAP